MKKPMIKIQLGKAGVTERFIDNLTKIFKNRDLVKISVLKSFSRDKQEIKNTANAICDMLSKKTKKPYTAKTIGFTIVIRKWRKLK